MHLDKPVLDGPLVRLRPLGLDDASALFEGLQDPEANRLMGLRAAFTLEDVQRHCRWVETAEERVDYAIEVKGRVIGEAVLSGVDAPNRSASFRIAVWRADDRNFGYGSEATRMIVEHGFEALALNRIELEVFAFNASARRVFEKVGFVEEGVRRQALWWDGAPVDALVMAMLRADYAAGR